MAEYHIHQVCAAPFVSFRPLPVLSTSFLFHHVVRPLRGYSALLPGVKNSKKDKCHSQNL